MILSGRKEIAAAIKESQYRIPYLVEHEGLPAWKRPGNSKSSPWKALPGDLERWVQEQADKYNK